jgi:hypothetical protein
MGLLSSLGGIAGSIFGGPIGGAIGGALGGAFEGRESVGAASQVQQQADQGGIDEQRRQFDAIQKLLQPYTQAGTGALAQQQALLGLGTRITTASHHSPTRQPTVSSPATARRKRHPSKRIGHWRIAWWQRARRIGPVPSCLAFQPHQSAIRAPWWSVIHRTERSSRCWQCWHVNRYEYRNPFGQTRPGRSWRHIGPTKRTYQRHRRSIWRNSTGWWFWSIVWRRWRLRLTSPIFTNPHRFLWLWFWSCLRQPRPWLELLKAHHGTHQLPRTSRRSICCITQGIRIS